MREREKNNNNNNYCRNQINTQNRLIYRLRKGKKKNFFDYPQ